jgi:hypothetical protein
MTFAPRKPFGNVNNRRTKKSGSNLLFINYLLTKIEKRGPIENLSGALDYRLEVIESNLSRVCNQ